jgi:peptidoglycan-N-acetylglucosamine deacetylase
VFQLTMHLHHSAHRKRGWMLEELICHAKARASVWFATQADIVYFARDNAQ